MDLARTQLGGILVRATGTFVTFCALFLLVPTATYAATLSLDPSTGSYGPGDTFMVTVRIDPGIDECINAVSGEIDYPHDILKASAVSKGESLLTLWPEEPSVDLEKGIVRFGGGIPAGYCGRVQGDPGKTNILAKIVFSVTANFVDGKLASSSSPIVLSFGPETEVLLNDGFGTKAPLITKGANFVRSNKPGKPNNEWLDIVHGDKMPPDLFTVKLESDPNTFQGKYFIVFSTVDKQSGVHHYEVTEDDPDHPGYILGDRNMHAVPVVATSPYVLKDQTLGSRVTVRAYDHAGNTEEALLAPKNSSSLMVAQTKTRDDGSIWWYVGVVLAVIVIGVSIFYARKRKEDLPPTVG